MRQIQHCGVPMWFSDANFNAEFENNVGQNAQSLKELKSRLLTKLYTYKLLVENNGLPATFHADLLAIDTHFAVFPVSTEKHLPFFDLHNKGFTTYADKIDYDAYLDPASKDDLASGEFFKHNPDVVAVVDLFT